MRMRFWLSPSAFLLFLKGQVNHVDTGWCTAVFHLHFTFITLNKQQVAIIIGTIGVIVAWLTALMAFGNDIFRNPFAQALIKNKIFPDEFGRKIFGLYLPYIINDSTV